MEAERRTTPSSNINSRKRASGDHQVNNFRNSMSAIWKVGAFPFPQAGSCGFYHHTKDKNCPLRNWAVCLGTFLMKVSVPERQTGLWKCQCPRDKQDLDWTISEYHNRHIGIRWWEEIIPNRISILKHSTQNKALLTLTCVEVPNLPTTYIEWSLHWNTLPTYTECIHSSFPFKGDACPRST